MGNPMVEKTLELYLESGRCVHLDIERFGKICNTKTPKKDSDKDVQRYNSPKGPEVASQELGTLSRILEPKHILAPGIWIRDKQKS